MLTNFDLTKESITKEENLSIAKVPYEDEIKRVIQDVNPWKAPDPDGLPALFYQKYWDFIGNDVVSFVHNFSYNKKLHCQVNHTKLVLIPKKTYNEYPSNYQLIVLCNVLYKVISKILANWIKSILHRLISPKQNVFVGSRQITDNVIIAKELFFILWER